MPNQLSRGISLADTSGTCVSLLFFFFLVLPPNVALCLLKIRSCPGRALPRWIVTLQGVFPEASLVAILDLEDFHVRG